MIKWFRNLFIKKIDEYDSWMEKHPDFFLDFEEEDK